MISHLGLIRTFPYKWGVIDDRFLIIPVNQTTVFILRPVSSMEAVVVFVMTKI